MAKKWKFEDNSFFGYNGLSAYTKPIYVSQLPKRERLHLYRIIKRALISCGTYTTESIIECLSEKIKDLSIYALEERKYDLF